MACPKSLVLSGAGVALEVYKRLVDGVFDRGGQGDDNVKRILRERALADEIADRLMDIERRVYVTPLHDTQVDESLRETAESWRMFAVRELGYHGFTAYDVVAGFRLKEDAPKTGLCYKDWQDLLDISFRNDEPTVHCTAFWVPRLLPDSMRTRMSLEQQFRSMYDVRDKFKLPAHHLTKFGSAALQSLLILDHARRTGERTPLDCHWILTNTVEVDGGNMTLGGFGGNNLRYGIFDDEIGSVGLGFFPLGVEVSEL